MGRDASGTPTEHEREMMRAIPTTYRDTAFRSRLEANYAATFDSLGMRWEYEVEGFELANGMRYLPDFWLPEIRAWVEVKGAHGERVDKFEAFSSQLWGEMEPDEYGEKTTGNPKSPLCVLASAGTLPFNDVDSVVQLIGVFGPGDRYSVALAPCPKCWRMTIVPIWSSICRNGGCQVEPVEWIDSYYAHDLPRPMVKAPVEQWRPPRRRRDADPFAGLTPVRGADK